MVFTPPHWFYSLKQSESEAALRQWLAEDWRRGANCVGETDTFDAVVDTPGNHNALKKAMSICGLCIVQDSCLDYALTQTQPQSERPNGLSETTSRIKTSIDTNAVYAGLKISAIRRMHTEPSYRAEMQGYRLLAATSAFYRMLEYGES